MKSTTAYVLGNERERNRLCKYLEKAEFRLSANPFNRSIMREGKTWGYIHLDDGDCAGIVYVIPKTPKTQSPTKKDLESLLYRFYRGRK